MSEGSSSPLADRRASADRRTTNERRRYNRRSAEEPASPPYYEVFERIATALESIARSVSDERAPRRDAQR